MPRAVLLVGAYALVVVVTLCVVRAGARAEAPRDQNEH